MYGHLSRYLSESERQWILTATRTFNPEAITAEIALTAWASQIHPASD